MPPNLAQPFAQALARRLAEDFHIGHFAQFIGRAEFASAKEADIASAIESHLESSGFRLVGK